MHFFTAFQKDGDTGKLFHWKFTTANGVVVLPSHLFEKVELYNNEIILSRLRSDVDINKLLGGSKNAESIEGRCVVIDSDRPDATESSSDPYIAIGAPETPGKPSEDGKISGLEYIDLVNTKGIF